MLNIDNPLTQSKSKMKTAEETLRDYCINRDYFFSQDDDCEITEVMKIYGRQVAEQALKDAVEKLNSDPYMTDSDIEFNRKVILNTEIKLP